MKPMIRMSDPRVSRIMSAKREQDQRGHSTVAQNWIELFRLGEGSVDMPGGALNISDVPDGAWRGQRCFIVGGGPSLLGFDFNRLRGDRVIAVNMAFYNVPFADIVFGMDKPLIGDILSGKFGEDCRRVFAGFAGVKIWMDIAGGEYPADIRLVPSAGQTGWTKSLEQGLCHGQNSGYGALNLAMILGADPIYLLGYDCAKGKDGEKNYHDRYPGGGNPDAMNIFKREFESGARMLDEGGPKIINLNPKSALTCFPFGDVDEVLPKTKSGGTITAITPTGDRPLAFRLCREWMANQTRRPDQWIIVNDGNDRPTEEDIAWFNRNIPGSVMVRREPGGSDPLITLNLNLKAALPYITGDKILIIEDDEYYAPGYVAEMARRLDSHEVVGICRSKYYHLPTGGYETYGNVRHASLAETGFRASFLPTFESLLQTKDGPRWLDDLMWTHIKATEGKPGKVNSLLFVDDKTPLYVGIKGLPGRNGIGSGHKTTMYHVHDGADRAQLRAWVPGDYQVYLDVLEGMA